MLQSIHLKGVGPAPELSLEFASRLNLLTGDNGLGKSFVLDIAWWALTGTWAGRQARPREDAEAPPTLEYQLQSLVSSSEKGGTPFPRYRYEFDRDAEWWFPPRERNPIKAGIVLYARVDGSFSIWDSIRTEENHWDPAFLSSALPDAYRFSSMEVWNGLTEGSFVRCEGLIRDWVTWQRQETESYLQLREVLNLLSPEGEELRPGEPTRVSTGDVRDHPTLEMPYGKIPIILASAGMRRIINLAYLLVWAWQEHQQAATLHRRPQTKAIIFLVDEIESHLHPKWQRLILPALFKVAGSLTKDVNVQILTTTHSPLVLASAEPLFDEDQDALFTFDLKDGQVNVSKANWRNQGDASSWLTSEVFDLGEARSVEAEQAIQQAKEAMRKPDIPIEERRRIHHDLNAVLKDTDPFWSRWLVQAKAAGIEP